MKGLSKKINTPTTKQRAAFKRTMENHGNVSKSMREVGYSENFAKNPQELTESEGWQELLKEHLHDTKLLTVLNEGLEATRSTEGGYESDFAVRHKYLETGLKLKSYFPKENQVAVQLNFNNIRKDYDKSG